MLGSRRLSRDYNRPHTFTRAKRVHGSPPCWGDVFLRWGGGRPCSHARATRHHFKAILCINPCVSMSVDQSECTLGCVCAGLKPESVFRLCVFCIHTAASAEFRLHRLLAYLTALLSSLISPVNVGLQLIENELACVSLQCLYKAVKGAHTPLL